MYTFENPQLFYGIYVIFYWTLYRVKLIIIIIKMVKLISDLIV